MTLKSAKLILWFARVWPLLMLATWLGLVLSSPGQQRTSAANEVDIRTILLLLVLPPYLALIYILLRPMIYPNVPDRRIAWLFFAGLTAGIGPVFLYWKKVDRWLTAWIKTEECKRVSNQRSQPIGGPGPPQAEAHRSDGKT